MNDESGEQDDRDPLQILCHAIRTPLGAAGNAVQLLRSDGVLTNEQRWALDLIERQITAITVLLDQQNPH